MSRTLILDGGTGRELKAIGAPFQQSQWSAQALLDPSGHAFVTRVHERFIAAGADVITTNSYALVPFHIGEAVFAARGAALARLAGLLARCAADGAPRRVLVAASLPPLESYRASAFDAARARSVLAALVPALSPSADVWLGETLSSIEEAQLVAGVVAELDARARPLWLSFTLHDSGDPALPPALRSGQAVADAVAAVLALPRAEALLFNCCTPEVVARAIEAAARAGQGRLRLGAYANAFSPEVPNDQANSVVHCLREDLDPSVYLGFARQWVAAGATMVGGCCGVGAAHIAALAALNKQ